MLVVHGVSLTWLILNKTDIETHFKENLKSTMETLNSNSTNQTEECNYMKMFSRNFHCCGYNGTKDFEDNKEALKCCDNDNDNDPGCLLATIYKFRDQVYNKIIIPSVSIIVTEVFYILASICVIIFSSKNWYTRI